MVLICGNTLQHVCRSPYRLYRPYHCDFQQATIPSSPSLYRAPNFDILSDFNRRSRRFERIASYQKVLSIIQVCEIFQPILFATAAFTTLYSVLRPTKSASQIAIASLVATLVPLFMFPNQSPFMINAMEAVRLSRLIDRSTTATRDEIKSEISSSLMSNVKRQQLARVPVRKISENGKAKDWKSIPAFSSGASTSSLSSSSSSTAMSFYAIQQLLTLKYLLIAYSFFSFAYSIVLLMMLIFYIQLIQLQ